MNPPAPGLSPQPPLSHAPLTSQKDSRALKLVLIGVGFMVLCIGLFIAVGGYFVYRTVRNAGYDPELMQRNPALALDRMAAAFNPGAEIISTDGRAGTVTIRDRKTGQTVTLKFDPEKKSLAVLNQEAK
jgi:hypothetical protein